ncbi:MAG TPA: Lrp/AsnC family transcriptional regulator [Rhodobacteraceae bacterium]|nr:Lrp/AsnC family transcriptional regulator [Paracoccaceae bacterium]
MQISEADRRLLRQLQHAPDAPVGELAARAGLSPATCTRRLDRLARAGGILGQRAVINWAALGYEVQVSLRITLEKSDPRAFDAFLAAAREVPEVLEIQTFLGRVDVRLHLLARDMGHYQQLYRNQILTLPHIAEVEALVQMAEIVADKGLPI